MSFETLLPIFAERLLKGGVDTYSIMLLGLGVGGLSGTVTLAWLGNLKNFPRFLLLSGTGFGLALASSEIEMESMSSSAAQVISIMVWRSSMAIVAPSDVPYRSIVKLIEADARPSCLM